MIGTYVIVDENGREVSECGSFSAARLAVRVHLACDGEESPLHIIAPDGKDIGTGVIDNCGNVVIRTTSASNIYENEVINRWGTRQ